MSKRAKRRTSHNFLGTKKALTVVILLFLSSLVVLGLIVLAYNFGFEQAHEAAHSQVEQAKKQRDVLRNRLQETLKSQEEKLPFVIDPAYTEVPPRTVEVAKVPPAVKKKLPAKPKLAVIIDDVSFRSEVKAVKALGLKLNLSFFPPTAHHPDTAFLASKEPFYMVHLPLEAMNFSAEEPHTLRVGDTLLTMTARLEEIVSWFPKVKYLNNHTGSKFTADYDAVKTLLKAARRLGLTLVDSRTTAQTKFPEIYEQYRLELLDRDVFLDHQADVAYICGQIKQAVHVAQNKGKAIAIGHPRPTTIKALGKCKHYFSDVELVYLNEL